MLVEYVIVPSCACWRCLLEIGSGASLAALLTQTSLGEAQPSRCGLLPQLQCSQYTLNCRKCEFTYSSESEVHCVECGGLILRESLEMHPHGGVSSSPEGLDLIGSE